jgi:exodeoxyribonuclease V beta subunit
LTYLLHGGPIAEDPDPARSLSALVKGLDPAAFFAPLESLVMASGGSIRVQHVDPASMPAPDPGEKSTPRPRLSARRFAARIDRSWRVASYSLLAADHRGEEASEAPDRDRIGAAAPRPPEDAPARPAHTDILDFPGGTRAGNFFHELLEKAPFDPDAGDSRRVLAARLLRRYRYDERWLDAVTLGVDRVLSTALKGEDSQLVLSSVPKERRLHEVSFFFPLKRIDGRKLSDLLPDLPPAGERLRFSPVQGYLKGYIDLVFQHGGRYFLVDWKSNRIGPQASDYHRPALDRVMAGARYHLQYALYSLALDLYLRQRDPEYRFDSGFGGVFYLFLRGMRPERGADWGVFFDRPKSALVTRLREQLVADNGPISGRNRDTKS